MINAVTMQIQHESPSLLSQCCRNFLPSGCIFLHFYVPLGWRRRFLFFFQCNQHFSLWCDGFEVSRHASKINGCTDARNNRLGPSVAICSNHSPCIYFPWRIGKTTLYFHYIKEGPLYGGKGPLCGVRNTCNNRPRPLNHVTHNPHRSLKTLSGNFESSHGRHKYLITSTIRVFVFSA